MRWRQRGSEELLVNLPIAEVRFLIAEAEAARDDAYWALESGFPGFTTTRDGHQFAISSKMDEAIGRIAKSLKKEQPSRLGQFTDKEWGAAVRQHAAQRLSELDFSSDREEATAKFLHDLRGDVSANVEVDDRIFSFGCNLATAGKARTFHLGPVLFEARENWLERQRHQKSISDEFAGQVREMWLDPASVDASPSPSYTTLSDIDHAIGQCSQVCSVTVSGLGRDAGQAVGLRAARLGLLSVALMWDHPSGALSGFRLKTDRPMFHRIVLDARSGGPLLASRWLIGRPDGPYIGEDEWARILTIFKPLHAYYGDMLQYYCDRSAVTKTSAVLETMLQTLFHFYEGCRSDDDLMAIVAFASSLDTLACGQQTGGICRLVSARYGIAEDRPLTKDGRTVREVVKEIYSSGRSQTLHGTNRNHRHDWSSTRRLSENIARHCIVECLAMASEAALDGPSQFQR